MSALDTSGGRILEKRLPLLRSSHVFSSAVRDVLESRLLREVSDGRVTLRQLHLLHYITLSGHHVEEVAEFLGVTPPAATRAVDQLERRGLVVRTGSDHDRRIRLLACSVEGQNLIERYRAAGLSRLAAVLESFTDDEIDQLKSLLDRCSVALLASPAASDTPCLRCSGNYDPACPVQSAHSRCPYQLTSKENR